MERQKEIKLFHEISKGNQSAFKEIFMLYYARLCGYIQKITGRKDIAEECVQSVFLKIWENRKKIVIKSSFKAYLFRSAHNAALKYLQLKKLEQTYSKYNQEVLLTKHSELPDTELLKLIDLSLDSLPPKCREIFILSRFEQLSHNQIAQRLKISSKTVEVQIRKANIRLREILKGLYN